MGKKLYIENVKTLNNTIYSVIKKRCNIRFFDIEATTSNFRYFYIKNAKENIDDGIR